MKIAFLFCDMSYLFLAPKILMAILLGLAVISYFSKYKIRIKYLIIGALAVFISYSGILTWLQYEAWEHNELAKYLLPPYQSVKYFISYAWLHFWLGAIFSIGLALIFFLILFLVKKTRKGFFRENDVELGFLLALIVGWPNFIFFLPLAFALTFLIALYSKIFKKQDYSSIALPFLIAAVIILIFGNNMVDYFDLGALRI